MATIKQHIDARNDNDLHARLVAAAEQEGIDMPENWVGLNIGRLVSRQVEVNGETTALADVHAYAVQTYTPTPRPGEDDTKITDDAIKAAVTAVAAG